jgi:hypothetical protein
MTIKLPLKKKQVDDVLSQEEQWANAQKTDGALLQCTRARLPTGNAIGITMAL